jgi:serine/threonine protein kinase
MKFIKSLSDFFKTNPSTHKIYYPTQNKSQMININGYEILTQIYESSNSTVYRGIRQDDNQPVILKFLKKDYPTPSELTRYKQEYEITRNLNLDGVIKAYELKPHQMTFCIILEDFGASSLKHLMNQRRGAGTNTVSTGVSQHCNQNLRDFKQYSHRKYYPQRY